MQHAKSMNRLVVFWLLMFPAFVSTGLALPQRLVIALDGIAYRDLKALQDGVTYTNFWGGVYRRQAFTAAEGYYPVSRLVSTFPSTSDVAWTDIFGNRPLPGYQRTYYSTAANSEIFVNGLTTTVEHESQMQWESENDFERSMGYMYSVHTFDYEQYEMMRSFWHTDSTNRDYYVYIRSSDDAQHMSRDILALLMTLDRNLQDLRARYRAQERRDLQIVILSDHAHNHAGRGRRTPIRAYLAKAGYRVTESITGPKDVVLPTSGIEDWIEIHNSPEETERLAERLTHLEGADIVAARLPGTDHRFLVLNAKGERAVIRWEPAKNAFQYSAEAGDPLGYRPAMEALARDQKLDADGFATADNWMNDTITNHYPLALERIVRGFTRVTLNPATILVSLDNHYVNDGWLVNEGSRLETYGSTHGALDDINSVGIVLSNFKPTHDTSSDRVAGMFDNFPGLRNYREEENGAEWVVKKEQAMTRISRDAFDREYKSLPDSNVFLRVWSPQLADAGNATLETTIEQVSDFADPKGSLQPRIAHEQAVNFGPQVALENCPYERIYACPPDLGLQPFTAYQISGAICQGNKHMRIFHLDFHTNQDGRPCGY
jgi:hypothetical protein